MSKRKAHVKLLLYSIVGILKKWSYELIPIPSLEKDNSRQEIIVSLTSYGRRVSDTVYYTILSIFHQTVKPSRIILWLDNDNWNPNNIPTKLKRLVDKGLEVKFCDDIKSYKKLIPTLRLYPEAVIITADDDVIYSSKLIESLYTEYQKNPNVIQCTRAYKVRFINGQPLPYKDWEIAKLNSLESDEILFPIGFGGVLYPPHSLYEDICRNEIFMELAPQADDLWFWYMARLKGTAHNYVALNPSVYSFDAIYQALHKGSALTHSNVGVNRNDVQLKAILDYYKK